MKLNFSRCINDELLCFQWNSAQILKISFPFRISMLFQHLMYILAKFNTFWRSSKPILKLNAFSILSTMRGNPEFVLLYTKRGASSIESLTNHLKSQQIIQVILESEGPVTYAENFHGGGFIQWCMVSFVFGVRWLWRHIFVFQTKILLKFALISHRDK